MRIWSACLINQVPFSMSYDGAKLRLVNMITSHVERAVTVNQMNAFNCCVHAETSITGYENIFFLAYNQSQVRAYDVNLERLAQLDIDIEVAVISMHWHKEKLRLYLAGTNGWVKCYQLKYKFVVSDFLAEWTLLFEIRATMDWIISMAHDDFHGILYGAAETSLLAFDLDTGKLRFTLSDVHDGYKICQVYVDNETSVATTSGLDGTVRTWLLKMKKCVTLNKIDLECPGWVSFARMGRSIITISSDRKIRHFGVSDSILRCEIDMSGSCKPPSPEEVIKANIVVLPNVKCIEGSLCVTSYQGNIQAALLGYAPEESLSFDSKVLQISYSERENNIMCLCEGNFLIVGNSEGPTSSIDLDVSCGPKCQRSGTSKTRCVCCYKDIVFAGLHNGGVKCITLTNLSDCRLLEDMPLDDPIIHLEVVEGMFHSNHPICGGLNPIPILPDHPFIIGFTQKGCISVWCGKCYSQVLKQDFEKPNMTQFIVRKDKKMIFVSGGSSLSVFRIEAYEFELVASLPTPGNQIMTSFVVTDDFVLVAGTSSGELLILQMEFDIETGDMSFNPKYRLRAANGIAKLFYDQDSGKVGATLVNGTVLAINPESGEIIFSKKNTEADPLSAILFLSKGGRLGVFLAFGTRLHFAEIDTTDPEPEPQEEEIVEEQPPEPEPEPEVEEEEEVSEATRQKEAQKRLHKLRKVLALAKLKKKRMRYIPECSSRFGPPPALPLPPPPPKLTYEEVMERNAKLVRNEYEAPKKVIKRPKTSTGTRRYHVVEYEDEQEDDEVGLMVQPFFYTDLPEDSKVMIPPVRPSSHYASRSQLSGRAKTPEKVVLYERNGNFAEIGNLEDLSESDLSEARASVSRDGNYMLSKTRTEKVRAPTIVHQAFVGPPSAPRVLFNDPTTRNGLSFFDPRGFQMPLFGSESEQGSQVGDEEGEMNGEEDANEESGEQILLKSMRQRSELEMRQMRKKKRVSMRDLMTPTTPTTKPKPKPKIFAKPAGHAETTKIDLTNKPRLSDIWRKPQEEQRRMQMSQNNDPSSGQSQTSQSKTQTITSSGETSPLMVITNANIKQDQLSRTQPSHVNEETLSASGTSMGASGSSSMTKGSDQGATDIGNQTSSSSLLTGQKQSEGEENLASQEPKITDIGMKRNMNVTRRRKPVQFQNTNTTTEPEQSTQVKETKPPETTKPEKTPPPTTPPIKKRKNEHEIVKASMSSRKPGNVKKPRKLTKVTSSKAAANLASTSTFTLQQPETVPPPVVEGQDDTIVLPPTQSAVVEVDPATTPPPITTTTAPTKKEDPFGYMFGQTLLSSRQEGGTERERPVENTLPLLPNLSRFWEQDMLFPVLPFSFGNPNTATAGSFCFTDRDAVEYAPNVTPVPFVVEKNGMDLVRRFNAIMDEIQGINNRPNQFDEDIKKSNPEDFIASIPRRTRRPSM